MRYLRVALVMTAALSLVAPSAAKSAIIVDFTNAQAVPGSNNFGAGLAGLGLTRYVTSGANLTLTAPGTISFEFLGSESRFSDAFEAPDVAFTETSSFENRFATPTAIGTSTFAAGSLAGLLRFVSSGGRTATLGEEGFTVFLDPNQTPGQETSVFYIGFDDQISGQDDDFDDLIVRGTLTGAIPEPGTWALLLMGFGLVGGLLRVRRRTRAELAT